ncbi:hypothetical protein [Undibacterium terreum]|uniref:hypothetical protein n=1 Tax=Undibacterium terreum TaxID=1224302 RepID=UPI001665CAD0|nr:hypothetical protein [Undibacterium terreum]
MRHKKWETGETRYAQTHPFLIHFLYRTIGEAPSGLSSKAKSKANSKTTATRFSNFEETQPHKFRRLEFDVDVGVVFEVPPLGTQHFVRYRKWIRNERCLSAASFVHFPFFVMQQNVMALAAITRRASLRSPFFAYFLWRSKERKWPPGHPRPAIPTITRRI